MGDRVPVGISGSLAPFVGVDLPIGGVVLPGTLLRGFFSVLTVSSSGPVVVEIRDASSQLHEFTIPEATRSVQEDLPVPASLLAGTALYCRPTDAGTGATDLAGWYELSESGVAWSMLTTLADVKAYAGETGSGNDGIIAWVTAGVSKAIQTRLRRAILTESISGEKLNGNGRYRITLPRYPVAASSFSITLEGTALSGSDFEVDEPAGQLWYTPGGGDPALWPRGLRNIELDYTAGFTAIPADIAMAATIQSVWAYKRTDAKGLRLGERATVLTDGGQNTYMVDAWAPEVLELLAPHQAPRRFI